MLQRRCRSLALAGILLSAAVALGQPLAKTYPFQSRSLSPEDRITNLLSLMTLDEKIGALGRANLDRLGVRWVPSVEGLHGLAQDGPANWLPKNRVRTTIFPQSYGLGSTWDPEVLKLVGEVEGYECRWIWQNKDLKQGAILAFAPNADLARDPRWGRTEESFGEDPHLVGELVAAMVKGLQGPRKDYWQCASLMKHFFANSNEDTRDFSSSNFDARQLREYYLVGFQKGVEAGSRAFMTAYNAYNGTPCTITPVVKEIAVKEWGMDGIVCTDGGAYRLLMTAHKHTDSPGKAAADCLKAGITRFLDNYVSGVKAALSQGLLTEADLDDAVRRNLRVQLKLGALDGKPAKDPYRTIGTGEAPWLTEKHKEAALLAARKSIVLLKNQDDFLPLDASKLKTLAVIGQRASENLLDWYSGKPEYAVTALKGIREKVPVGCKVLYSRGGQEALEIAAKADAVIVVVGNHPLGGIKQGWAKVELPSYGREAVDRKSLDLEDEALVKEVMAVNPKTVLALQSSFPYAINWSQEHVPAIVHFTHSGQEMGAALADVLFGDYNPAGRTTQTWVKSLADLPPLEDYDLTKGRTYLYFGGEPLYPFGYGLSYTKFVYRKAELGLEQVRPDGAFNVEVTVANVGKRDGEEVIQVYAEFPDSQVKRPIKQLKAFQRVEIKAGRSRLVRFHIPAANFAYWDEAGHKWVVEPGRINLLIGGSSTNLPVRLTGVCR